MPDWVAWSGVVGTFVFGILSMFQWIQSIREKARRDAHRDHLLAVKRSLEAVRDSCTEAINQGEIVKTDAVKQFVRLIAYQLVGIEGHIDAALGMAHVPQPPSPPVGSEMLQSGSGGITSETTLLSNPGRRPDP